jgi:hypothetical protein
LIWNATEAEPKEIPRKIPGELYNATHTTHSA